MSKTKKTWLITAAVLAAAGLILFAAAMSVNNWNFSKLFSSAYHLSETVISDEFGSVSINTDTADICVLPAEDGICRISFYEPERIKHSASVENGVLVIRETDSRKWYHQIVIMPEQSKVLLYLPHDEYRSLSIEGKTGGMEISNAFTFGGVAIHTSTGNVDCFSDTAGGLTIQTTTGDIRLENLSAESVELHVTSGDVYVKSVSCERNMLINVGTGKSELSDVTCGSIASSGSTGNILLRNAIVYGKLQIDRSTGNIQLDKCDASELKLNTSTGDVTGSLLSEKVYITQSKTGSIHVPKTASGGRCEITTSTGDIRIGRESD